MKDFLELSEAQLDEFESALSAQVMHLWHSLAIADTLDHAEAARDFFEEASKQEDLMSLPGLRLAICNGLWQCNKTLGDEENALESALEAFNSTNIDGYRSEAAGHVAASRTMIALSRIQSSFAD